MTVYPATAFKTARNEMNLRGRENSRAIIIFHNGTSLIGRIITRGRIPRFGGRANPRVRGNPRGGLILRVVANPRGQGPLNRQVIRAMKISRAVYIRETEFPNAI